eukprot:4747188-Pleurochrysis_carterae.AAC.4
MEKQFSGLACTSEVFPCGSEKAQGPRYGGHAPRNRTKRFTRHAAKPPPPPLFRYETTLSSASPTLTRPPCASVAAHV